MTLFDHFRSEPVYNTRAVVQRTGVPADTFRAWERRYGLPRPSRTAGNQRLYSERDIAIIDWLRDRTRAGVTISQAVALYQQQETEAARDVGTPRNAGSSAESGRAIVEVGAVERLVGFRLDILDALVSFDSTRADRVVEESLALIPVEDVCLHVLQPVLIEIGDRWERGEVTVSAEHYASGFVVRKLGALFNLSRPEFGRGPLVAACLEGELHEVGLLLTCLFLSRRGYRIVYLGPNLPLGDLVACIKRVQPAMTLLSSSTRESAAYLIDATRDLRRMASNGALGMPQLTVGYGGSVFMAAPELRGLIDGVFLGENAAEVVDTVNVVVRDSEL